MFEIGPIMRALWRNKAGPLLLVMQLALTLAIVSNGAFLIHQRQAKIDRPTGVAEDELFSLTLMPATTTTIPYADIQRYLAAVRALPGVTAATVTNQVPLSDSGTASSFNRGVDDGDQDIPGNLFLTDEQGLATFGLQLVAGRDFRPGELVATNSLTTADPKVAIISRQLADALFGPGVNPLGQLINRDYGAMAVIGVVEPFIGSWVNWRQAGNTLLLPSYYEDGHQRLMVRSAPGERARLMQEVPALLNRLDRQQVVVGVKTLNEFKDRAYNADHTLIRTLTLAIILLGAITALGMVGLTLFWVNQRRKQIGTRRALGACRAAILRYFLVENGLISGVGLALGVLLALAANQLMVQHYQMAALDPAYLLASALALWLLGLVAAAIPAWRAACIAPALATRSV